MKVKNRKNISNILLIIVICLLVFISIYSYKIYNETNKNYGSIEHYDSLYTNRSSNISMNQKGEVIGYYTPENIYFEFKIPINANDFYNN